MATNTALPPITPPAITPPPLAAALPNDIFAILNAPQAPVGDGTTDAGIPSISTVLPSSTPEGQAIFAKARETAADNILRAEVLQGQADKAYNSINNSIPTKVDTINASMAASVKDSDLQRTIAVETAERTAEQRKIASEINSPESLYSLHQAKLAASEANADVTEANLILSSDKTSIFAKIGAFFKKDAVLAGTARSANNTLAAIQNQRITTIKNAMDNIAVIESSVNAEHASSKAMIVHQRNVADLLIKSMAEKTALSNGTLSSIASKFGLDKDVMSSTMAAVNVLESEDAATQRNIVAQFQKATATQGLKDIKKSGTDAANLEEAYRNEDVYFTQFSNKSNDPNVQGLTYKQFAIGVEARKKAGIPTPESSQYASFRHSYTLSIDKPASNYIAMVNAGTYSLADDSVENRTNVLVESFLMQAIEKDNDALEESALTGTPAEKAQIETQRVSLATMTPKQLEHYDKVVQAQIMAMSQDATPAIKSGAVNLNSVEDVVSFMATGTPEAKQMVDRYAKYLSPAEVNDLLSGAMKDIVTTIPRDNPARGVASTIKAATASYMKLPRPERRPAAEKFSRMLAAHYSIQQEVEQLSGNITFTKLQIGGVKKLINKHSGMVGDEAFNLSSPSSWLLHMQALEAGITAAATPNINIPNLIY